jgi:hypothetical protein
LIFRLKLIHWKGMPQAEVIDQARGFRARASSRQDGATRKILHDISDVATDPNSRVTRQGRTTLIEGRRDGVDIRVVERDGRIVTGYPTNLPRNPNP